ncbi:Gp37-like protein [Aminipila sp.]|uniref:Gp37-like protein n=1 Tax=Aminipila sp. TaxID=2060095 RepID=UPI00289699F3|nr:hypothetical protein [Aminipila sp.]
MEIYILNEKMDRIGTVDVYQSFSWNTSYSDVGSFELHCPVKLFALLKEDRIVQNTEDDKHNGIIERIEKSQDDEGVEKLIVKGRMIEAYLDRRIALGSYTFVDMQPAQIACNLITQNVIAPSDANRKIDMQIGELVNADEGTVCYAGANEKILDITKKLCDAAQLGFRLYADDENKKFIFDVFKGVNRTEEDNTTTSIEVQKAINVLNAGHFENYLTGWNPIDGGTNYQGEEVLSVEPNPRLFKKTKIKDRYAEYWKTTGKFRRWVYFFRKAGYIYGDIQLNKDHIYYIDIKCSNPTDSVLGYGIIDSEGGYTFNVDKTSGFERFNTFYVPESSGTYKFAMAYGELPEIEGLTVETEYGGMIDLTATFGVGKEPDLDWCNNNMYYENGIWKYKVEIISFIPNSADQVVLSRDRDTLVEVEYLKNITNECTTIYVKGDGIDTTVSTGNIVGLLRKERFLDLSGITRVRDSVTIPEPSYIAMLQTNAKATLRKLVVNEIIDGKLYLLSNKKFGRDFYLGDIVTCTDDSIGFSTNLRITAATETWDINGYQISVILGDDIPDIYETIKLVTKGAK